MGKFQQTDAALAPFIVLCRKSWTTFVPHESQDGLTSDSCVYCLVDGPLLGTQKEALSGRAQGGGALASGRPQLGKALSSAVPSLLPPALTTWSN